MTAIPSTPPPRPGPPPIPRRHPSRSVSATSSSKGSSPLTRPSSLQQHPAYDASSQQSPSPPDTAADTGDNGVAPYTPSTLRDSSSSSHHHHHETGSNGGGGGGGGGDWTHQRSRPPSNILLGPRTPARPGSPNAPPVSPGMRLGPGALGLGAAGAVGLGPVRIDFKDWVKAGREGSFVSTTDDDNDDDDDESIFRDADEPAYGHVNSDPGRPSPSSAGGGANDANATAANGLGAGSDMYRSSSLQRTKNSGGLPTSNSLSSLSIDSNHSPQGIPSVLMRISSRTSDRAPTAAGRHSTITPRGTSHELVREMSNVSISRSSRRGSSHRYSLPATPLNTDSPSASGIASPSRYQPHSPVAIASPLERRFSRRMNTRRDSAGGLASSAVEEEDGPQSPAAAARLEQTLDDRIREAEERLARRQSLRNGGIGDEPHSREAVSPMVRRFESVRLENTLSPAHRPGVATTSMDASGTEYDHDSASRGSRGSGDRGGSGSRLGKVRQPIPAEFHNGRLFSPSPKADDTYHASPRQHIDLSDSPRSQRTYGGGVGRPHSVLGDSPRWTNGRSSTLGSSRLSRDFDTYGSPARRELGSTRARPESVLETLAVHDRYSHGSQGYYNSPHRSNTYGNEDRTNRVSAVLSEFGVRASVTPERSYRRSREFAGSRDFGSYHGGGSGGGSSSYTPHELRPSDSASMTGNRSELGSVSAATRKDPLDVIRRLEETRTQHNRSWEDRSASVLGDRSASVLGNSRYGGEREVLASTRPTSRMDDGAHAREMRSSSRVSHVRPQTSMSSMSSVRDQFSNNAAHITTPRTAPVTRRRTESTDDAASVADSPLMGRTSRASHGSYTGPSTEPRVRLRSQTSIGGRSQGSSNPETTEHGRNLLDSARLLDARKADIDPATIEKLQTAAKCSERTNVGLHAALAIASSLAVDVEIDNAAAIVSVRERLPRLSVTLREAARSSDQASRDLTEALLAVRSTTAAAAPATPVAVTTTPARASSGRRPESMYTPGYTPLRDSAEAGSTHRRGWSTNTFSESPRNDPRHSPSQSTSSIHSPLLRFNGRETPRNDRPPSSAGRYDSGASNSSRYDNGGVTSSRFDGPRSLDPIEQSPPKPTAIHHPTDPEPLDGGLGVSTASDRPTVRASVSPRASLYDTSSADVSSDTVSPSVTAQAVASPKTPFSGGASSSPGPQPWPSNASPRHSWQASVGAASSPQPSWHTASPSGIAGDEHNLRKQSSLASTHTVRPTSFVPSHPPEPTTAVSNSPAYSQQSLSNSLSQRADSADASLPPLEHAHAPLVQHEKSDSITSLASVGVVSVTSGHPSDTASNVSAGVIATGPVEVTRAGTFGAADGARARASVSERFRKHLNGENSK
ncbi:uncharacterized protein EHS24_005651 [Apiotrichum porosum]|uniref:Uncharacterized protein n=1 Tax=Apiotrichum porosum TaxID=105984 RepID=A0A427XZ34_9TREE|nr:uncharacterized protein EHS24_005651 [Apiotrichum porosum]RSH84148.1 hypothetical protein EHS24_005651 [Apiotrichum porosum]